MGLDVSGVIIVGEKYIKKTEPEKVKKYNVDTGEPFFVESLKHKFVLENDESILLDYSDEDEFNDDENWRTVFDSSCHELYAIQGFVVSETELRSDIHIEEVYFHYLSELISRYNKITGRLPRIWNFMSYSS